MMEKQVFLTQISFVYKEEIFHSRVVRYWSRLPREVEDALSLELFNLDLDGALSNLT